MSLCSYTYLAHSQLKYLKHQDSMESQCKQRRPCLSLFLTHDKHYTIIYTLPHCILTTTLGSKHYYYSHFVIDETKAQRA